MLGWIIDLIPGWVWWGAAFFALAATYPYWRPVWALLPTPIKIAVAAVVAAIPAYLNGRNKGATGALQRAREKEQARAEDIIERGTAARERADRDAVSGGLRDDDGHRRDG
jgi:hypothetical protein